jgi:hypothetical protein
MKKKRFWGLASFFMVIAIILSLIFVFRWPTLIPGYHYFFYTPSSYIKLKNKQALKKTKFNTICKADSVINAKEKQLIFQQLDSNLIQLFAYWYGTKWSFNGVSQIPGNGSIACGYFVTTLLRDAGLPIDRVKLAQMGSEAMIQSLCDKKSIHRYNNYKMYAMLNDINKLGNGIYLLGLDTHTGFIWKENKQIWFVHSSGRFPFRVKKEQVQNSVTIWKSKYKVLGQLTNDSKVINCWLQNK